MKYDVVIEKIDEVNMKVKCSEISTEKDIGERFSFKIPGAEFKNNHWDGTKRLYNRRTKLMYVGLFYELISYLKKRDFTFKYDESLVPSSNMPMEDLEQVVKEFIKPHDEGKPLEPYDDQYDALYYMLNMDRSLPVVATSGGKSLVLYIAARIYQMTDDMDDKTMFIIVPSKLLVEQMYSDFENYSTYEGSRWNVRTFCQKINGDYDKTISKQIVITTWQSLKDIPKYAIQNAGAIFCDEVHLARANVLTDLMETATNCPIKHGVTGSLDRTEMNELHIQGLFGPKKTIVTAKELIDKGRATPLDISMIMLDYSADTKKEYYEHIRKLPKRERFNGELEFIYSNVERKKFLFNLLRSLEGNTIILFDRVEKFGNLIYEEYKKEHKNTFLITGDVETDVRDEIRRTMEQYDDAVIFASSQTMSTGVSIKKLHNLIFASSSKSVIRVIQSIGRMLRKHHTKEFAKIFDIVDKLDYCGIRNYTLKHAEERVKIYSSEKHKMKFFPVSIK